MKRRFPGYFVIREYGHRMPTQFPPLFVASKRRAERLADAYRHEADDRYATAFYAYVVPACELHEAQASAHSFAPFPVYREDPRHSLIRYQWRRNGACP